MKSFQAKSTTKRVLWGLLSLTLLSILYYENSDKEKRPNCSLPPISPRANADGTVDHVIIRKCEGNTGEYFIVRFAADQSVTPSGKMEPTEVGGFGGPAVVLSSHPNDYVTAHFNILNSWQLIPKGASNSVDIRYQADVTFSKWGDLTKEEYKRGLADADIACEKPVQHSNGILEYRPKNDRDRSAYPGCFRQTGNQKGARTYVSTNPIAVVECFPPRGGDDSGQCRGSVDTPGYIYVEVFNYLTSEPTPEHIAETITIVNRIGALAFVKHGELQPDENFEFARHGQKK